MPVIHVIMAPQMKRRFVFSLLLCVSAVLACSRPDRPNVDTASDSGQPVQGDWAVVRLESDPDGLNPLTTVNAVAQYVMWGARNSQVYELLMGYNTKDWDVTEPLLAEGPPTVSDDHLTYTIKVRDGVKWHDGKPFTVDDVVFTYKAAACPTTDAARYRSSLTDLADIQVDGRTIKFVMRQPNVFNLRNVVTNLMPIMPKHVFDEKGLLDGFSYKDIISAKAKTDPKIKEFGEQFNKHAASRAPIGTGPYKFEKWESGREIVLTRNDDYWGKKPYLDKIVYRVITDSTAALTALKAGEVDLQPRLQPIQYNEQTSGPAFDAEFAKVSYSIPSEFQIIGITRGPFLRTNACVRR